MRTKNFIFVREKAGVISQNKIWVLYLHGYLYCNESLFKLIWEFITEYEHDRHLVG